MDIASYLLKNKGIKLSDQQYEAVVHQGGILLLAVPGAGKTTVLTTRIAHLMLTSGINPSSIKTLTFSRESARDMANRFNYLFGDIVDKAPSFSTIHAFCYRLLRSQKGALPELLADGRQIEIFRGIFRETAGRFADDDLIDNARRYHSLLKNRMEAVTSRHNAEFGVQGLDILCRGYDDFKERNGVMDFDDMLSSALSLLMERPDISSALRRSSPYLLVDEAQDMTALQHEIVREIATEDKMFVVGDDDQCIYSFRGTDARLMLNMPSKYPEISVLKLEETFRLTPQVCDAANRLISLNKKRFGKNIVTSRDDGASVEFVSIGDSENQGDYIAKRINSLNFGETTAVLYRNNPSAFGTADALDRAGIDFYIREQKVHLKKIGIVADILAFFALSGDSGNLEAFSRIYYKMGAYISRQMLDWTLSNTPPGGNVFDTLCESPNEGMSTARILYAKNQIARLIKSTTPKAIDAILNNLEYLDFLTSRAGGGVRLEQDAQLLDAIRTMAIRYPSPEDFLDRIDSLDELLAKHSDSSRKAGVTLSTVHSAKGLEFDNVFIIDFMDGVLPSAHTIEDVGGEQESDFEEEVRIAFVAATRAKKKLTLTCPSEIAGRGLTQSRFISVITGDDDAQTNRFVGTQINHKYFGYGKIIEVNPAGGSITVNFGKLGIKSLDASILEKNKLVSIINHNINLD